MPHPQPIDIEIDKLVQQLLDDHLITLPMDKAAQIFVNQLIQRAKGVTQDNA